MGEEEKTKEDKSGARLLLDTLDIVAMLLAALTTGILAVVTGFISSLDTFTKKPPPLHALGPVALAGAATGIWIRRRLFRRKPKPPRPRCPQALAASALTIAGLAVWFVGIVEFVTYFRPYIRDLSLATWTVPGCLALAGTLLITLGRFWDLRLRKSGKGAPTDAGE